MDLGRNGGRAEREVDAMSERQRPGQGDLRLGGWAGAVESRLEGWRREGFGDRLWRRDHTLWSPEPVPELADRLGWLDLPGNGPDEADVYATFGEEVAEAGFQEAVILGMGGSSLAPEVFARTFGAAGGRPRLTVLDSTHPDAVGALAERLARSAASGLGRTLFVVSSKSGTTIETLSFFRFFWDAVGRALAEGGDRERRFAAVTDPGSSLDSMARQRGFRAVFNAPEDVGGRFSALSAFGLVPAALLGMDVRELLARARAMASACADAVPEPENPGLRLGAALGELALAGRDKLTFLTTPGIASFPDWIEQLVAESTGKAGRGIVPVVGEPFGAPESYGDDRFFVGLSLAGDDAGELEALLGGLERAGHPVARFRLDDGYDLGAEMFRWEMATAAAGAVLGVNPFDQPDVQLAKELAKEAMKEARAVAGGPAARPGSAERGAAGAAGSEALGRALEEWLDGVEAGDYLGLQAYLAPTEATERVLRELQAALGRRTGRAVTAGWGPRFLHSTGQLHKGGPASGRFLQLVDEPSRDLPIPETDSTFGALVRAQAEGDRLALSRRGRRVLRVDLGRDAAAGLARLAEGVREGSRV
jgi:transaldolase / glucose-6-phosphate isomerase